MSYINLGIVYKNGEMFYTKPEATGRVDRVNLTLVDDDKLVEISGKLYHTEWGRVLINLGKPVHVKIDLNPVKFVEALFADSDVVSQGDFVELLAKMGQEVFIEKGYQGTGVTIVDNGVRKTLNTNYDSTLIEIEGFNNQGTYFSIIDDNHYVARHSRNSAGLVFHKLSKEAYHEIRNSVISYQEKSEKSDE